MEKKDPTGEGREEILATHKALWETRHDPWDAMRYAHVLSQYDCHEKVILLCEQVETEYPEFTPIHTHHAWSLYALHFLENGQETFFEGEFARYNQVLQEIRTLVLPIGYSPENVIFLRGISFLWSKPVRPLHKIAEWLGFFDPLQLSPRSLPFQRDGSCGETHSPRESWYLHMAMLQQEKQDWPGCLHTCESALDNLSPFSSKDPGGWLFRFWKGKSLSALHVWDAALVHFQELGKTRADWTIYQELAWIHWKRGDDLKAFRNALRAMLHFPSRGELQQATLLLLLLGEFFHQESLDSLGMQHWELFACLHAESRTPIPTPWKERLEEAGVKCSSCKPAEVRSRFAKLVPEWKEKFQQLLVQESGTIQKLYSKGGGIVQTADGRKFFFPVSLMRGREEQFSVGTPVHFRYDDVPSPKGTKKRAVHILFPKKNAPQGA
ncbi:MAG TPA: hypothetical protein P5560_10650 [Thermotogota bacterium]|nr:hypothetical protein [Thermotogota bacterium]HRW93396.1 hypothetical protein [Thermotogota bacterium]